MTKDINPIGQDMFWEPVPGSPDDRMNLSNWRSYDFTVRSPLFSSHAANHLTYEITEQQLRANQYSFADVALISGGAAALTIATGGVPLYVAAGITAVVDTTSSIHAINRARDAIMEMNAAMRNSTEIAGLGLDVVFVQGQIENIWGKTNPYLNMHMWASCATQERHDEYTDRGGN